VPNNPVILPEKYYLDYFNYVLDFVERKYEHILDEPEYNFYSSFRGLTEDAKCLYLRFSNRKGHFFRVNKLSYREITNINSAKKELMHHRFIRINENRDPIQFQLFTKAELLANYSFLNKKDSKENLLIQLTDNEIDTLHEKEEIAETLMVNEVEFIKLLFFGDQRYQMTDFVIRDVGNVRLQKLDESKFKPWCQTRDEALAVMQIAELKTLIRTMRKEGMTLETIVNEVPWENLLQFPTSKKRGGKLLVEIGKYLEQDDQMELALDHYKYTTQYPARERSIRILEKLNRSEEGISLANKIFENPVNASEFTFASDYLRRSGIRINRSMTERLKDAPVLKISKNPRLKVENAVLVHLADEGWNGFHAENFVWRGLFGLIFWDEIFSQDLGNFHHPLQREPSDIENSDFFLNRDEQMKKLLNELSSKKKLYSHIRRVYKEKEGMANRLVVWHESLLPAIKVFIDHLTLKSIKEVMLEIPKNIRENSTGFPDLFVWKEKEYMFYEVKSPNDQLSAQQLFWLDYMQKIGIKADVLKVEYLDND